MKTKTLTKTKLRYIEMCDDIQIKYGVVGGTLLSTAFNISINDILFTVVMAFIGAVVSFFVSYVLKKLFGSNK